MSTKWTAEMIISAVKERHDSGKSMRYLDVAKDGDRRIYNAAMTVFGDRGWEKARTLAGIPATDPDPRIIWTKETIVDEIHRLQKSGIALNHASLQENGLESFRTGARKVFGSWAKAIAAAGLNYDEIRKIRRGFWSAEEVKKQIKLLETQGVRLNSQYIQANHTALFAASLVHYGCWSRAVEAAGISYRKHCRIWSTKAWLRRMQPEEYQIVLKSSQALARERKRK